MAGTHSERSSSKNRTLTGIVAHPVGLLLGIVGAGPLYLLARNGFTTENARNALNWQIAITIALAGLTVVAFAVPSSFDAVVVAAIFGIFFLLFVDFVVVLYATVKAISGEAWEYPVAPKIV